MGHSFLSQIAQKIVETYIARRVDVAPVAPQPEPIEPPVESITPPIIPITPPIVSIPTTPPNERITEIDFKQAAELHGINQNIQPDQNRIENLETIYARYLTEFPLFPELPPRSPSPEGEQWSQVLEDVPITPPSAPISPDLSETFDVVDLSP